MMGARDRGSSITKTPSGNSEATAAATAMASRVLPTPAGPVRLTSRHRASSAATSAVWSSRPTRRSGSHGGGTADIPAPMFPGCQVVTQPGCLAPSGLSKMPAHSQPSRKMRTRATKIYASWRMFVGGHACRVST